MAGEEISLDNKIFLEQDNDTTGNLSSENNDWKTSHTENKSDLPDFKLTVQNPVEHLNHSTPLKRSIII